MPNFPGASDPATGLIEDPGLLNSPGPGGVGSGLASGIAILNAVKSAELAQQADAQRKMAYMQQIQKEAEQSGGTDFFNNPEGQDVLHGLGVSPQTATSLAQGTPTARIQKAIGEWQALPENQGKRPTLYDLQPIYSRLNITMPNAAAGASLYNAAGKLSLGQQRVKQKAIMEAEKFYLEQRKLGETDDVAAQGAMGVIARQAPFFNDDDEFQANLDSWKSKFESSTGKQAPTVAAKIGLQGAQQNQAQAHADYYKAIQAPMVGKINADANYARAHAEGVKAATEIKKIISSGKWTPQLELQVMKYVNKEDELAGTWEYLASTTKDSDEVASATAKAQALRGHAQEARKWGEEGKKKSSFRTPDDIKNSNLPPEEKLRLLKELFPNFKPTAPKLPGK